MKKPFKEYILASKLDIKTLLNYTFKHEKFINSEWEIISLAPAFIVTELKDADYNKIVHEQRELTAEDMYNEFVNEKYLFVTFTGLGALKPLIPCMDEHTYYLDEATSGFTLEDTSILGYVFAYDTGQVKIQYGIHRETYIEIIEDAGIFQEPMKDYLNRFIK
ncbi:MAG: hypothetical protein ACI35O_14220 [Bacillaceae bacterium]